jgi:hypothetical protein
MSEICATCGHAKVFHFTMPDAPLPCVLCEKFEDANHPFTASATATATPSNATSTQDTNALTPDSAVKDSGEE